MRSSATLLVLLLCLPGLVLPAGFLLRICRCAAIAANTAAAAPACCAARAAATPAAESCACCQLRGRAKDRSDQGAVLVASRSCKCVWVKLPDHQPKPVLPQQAPGPDVVALPPANAGVTAPLADAGRRLPRFEVARPPPWDDHRNHPLLL